MPRASRDKPVLREILERLEPMELPEKTEVPGLRVLMGQPEVPVQPEPQA